MADIQSLNHCGLSVPDLREAEEWYARILGGHNLSRTTLEVNDVVRGKGGVHTTDIVLNYAFATFVHPDEAPMPPRPRGNASRHAFAVPRERFEEYVAYLQANAVPFEGPVDHPENGPLGQSVYFTDPGGNYFEVCWRRDQDSLKSVVSGGGY